MDDPRQELTRPPLDYLKAVADIPEDLAIAFKVLCNAAKADKARLQQLEVEVARHSHRADTAEQECQELRKKLHMAERQQSKVDEDLMMQVMQQAERHQAQAAKLQQKLNQRGVELALRQQEVQRLQQQLGNAEDRARRAEESTSAIREALGAHVKMGQQLASLLSIKTQPPIQVPGSRPLTMETSFGNPLFSPTDGGLQEAAAEAAAREEGGAESRRSWDRRDGQVQGERKPGANCMLVARALRGPPGATAGSAATDPAAAAAAQTATAAATHTRRLWSDSMAAAEPANSNAQVATTQAKPQPRMRTAVAAAAAEAAAGGATANAVRAAAAAAQPVASSSRAAAPNLDNSSSSRDVQQARPARPKAAATKYQQLLSQCSPFQKQQQQQHLHSPQRLTPQFSDSTPHVGSRGFIPVPTTGVGSRSFTPVPRRLQFANSFGGSSVCSSRGRQSDGSSRVFSPNSSGRASTASSSAGVKVTAGARHLLTSALSDLKPPQVYTKYYQ